MKRHEALAPFSREHHDSLILAQLLKKDTPAYRGLPSEPESKAVYAANLFRSGIQEHFNKEEAMLEKVKDCHTEIQKLAEEIISEHRQLTASFLSLDSSTNLADTLDVLGNELEKHIRKEERVLFPLIQKYCSDETLLKIQ